MITLFKYKWKFNENFIYSFFFFFKIQWTGKYWSRSPIRSITLFSTIARLEIPFLRPYGWKALLALIILSIRSIDKEFIWTACLHPTIRWTVYAFLRTSRKLTNAIIESQTCSDAVRGTMSTIHLRTEFLLNFHRNCAIRQFLFPFLFDDVNSTISSKLITSFIVENFSSLTRETWKFHRYFSILRGGWDGKMINKFWKLWDLEIVWC